MRPSVAAVKHAAILPASNRATALDALVIVGNGMVGHRLCRRLIELGATDCHRVVVFGEEREPAYDRVHLTSLFEGQTEENLRLAPEEWYADHGIELHLGDPVVEIDCGRRTVTSASGFEVEYRKLVLATGSAPFVPPIPGVDLPGVFVYRTVADLRAIRRRARTARTAAVIGGGLLGLEAARALQSAGLEITVVEAAASLMPAQLDQQGGKELERQIVALGIGVATATVIERIVAAGTNGKQRTLCFAAGGSVTADMVVVAAGVRPRGQLAAACGLARSPDGGVIVDDRLATSDSSIWAVGECASHRSGLNGLVAPGYAMADALAMNFAGRRATFSGVAPTAKLKLLDVDVASAGEPLQSGRAGALFHAGRTYRRLRFERGRLVGALGVGEWPEFARIQDATVRQRRIWPWDVRRFERTGRLWPDAEPLAVTAWPSERMVCNCLGVTRGQIGSACGAGAATLESIVERTGASTLCGSCRPLVAELAGAGSAGTGGVSRGLFGASVAALAIAAALLVAAPFPFSSSVQGGFHPDVLWRHGGFRQITGFSLLALAVLASLLSARKRIRRLSFGPFSSWRIAHAAIGGLSLLMVGVHTGARMGDNLNFALVTCFIALNVAGGLAGTWAALEPKLSVRRRWRAALVTAHVLAVGPLPALVGFHVLSVYYF